MEMKYECMGIKFNVLKKCEDLFELVDEWDEQSFFVSKETFKHNDGELIFDYKYVIEVCMCEGRAYYSLNLVVMPDSCCDKYISGVLDCCGYDGENKADLSVVDLLNYGGGNVQFGCETEEYNEDEPYEVNVDLLNKIASIFDCMDGLRGFYIDRTWNMIGSTGWDTLEHCVKGDELFKAVL